MAEIGRWGGHKFEVSPNVIRGMENLTIKGSSETEEKESGGEKYVSRKNGKPAEVSMTIRLNAALGCNVRDEAMDMVNGAINGAKDYFYVGNKKLVTCQLMLTEASVKEIGITNNGTWTRADVSITMKQCSKNDGSLVSSSGGGGGGGSSGSKKTSVKKTETKSIFQKVVDKVKDKVNTVKAAVTGAVSAVKNALTSKTTKATNTITKTVNAVKAVKAVTTAAKAASVVSKVKNLLKVK